jgi:hypothetical protein
MIFTFDKSSYGWMIPLSLATSKNSFQKERKNTQGQVHLKLSSHFNTCLSINKLILGIPIQPK